MIFDTHTHYDDHAYDEDRTAVLTSLAKEGVGRVVAVAASVQSLDRVRELTRQYDFVYGAVGLHPDEVGACSRPALEGGQYLMADGIHFHKVEGLTDDVLKKLRLLLAEPGIVAVGEIGLDYHWNVESHEIQQAAFQRQMELAIEAKRPILVHSRTAAADTLRLIERMYGEGRPGAKISKAEAERSLAPGEYETVPGKEWVWRKELLPGPGRELPRKGILHAYAYSLEQARIYTKLGFLLGIGGVLTYNTSRKLKKVAAEIPLEFLVLETDCPYLAPEPYRGTRNVSSYLHEVVRMIAEIKGVTESEVEAVTWENACRVFGTDPEPVSFMQA